MSGFVMYVAATKYVMAIVIYVITLKGIMEIVQLAKYSVCKLYRHKELNWIPIATKVEA